MKKERSRAGAVLVKDFWKDRSVFVTGASGLLGSWLVKYLLEQEARVIALVRDEVPNSNLAYFDLARKVVTVRGDLSDYLLLRRVVNEYEVQTVYHLAAQTIVGVANNDPLSTFEANIRGTWNMLEACRHRPGVREIIVSSSDKAYGTKDKLPYHEDDPLQGAHPYDVSKSCADLITQSYFKTYDLPVCVTRCANLYGGGDLNFNRIVPGTIRSALAGDAPIIRSDGTFLRDYFYVEDAVSAFIMLAEKMHSHKVCGEAFNFSSGTHLTVSQIVNRILQVMQVDLKPRILNEVTHEIKDQYLSVAKAKRLLGWESQYAIDDGLRQTVKWYAQHLRKI